jgi:hypothetical protein
MDQVYGGGAAAGGGGGGYPQQAQQPSYPDQSAQVGAPTQLFTPGMAGNDQQQPQQPFYPQQAQPQQPAYGQAPFGGQPAGGVDQMANQFQGMNVGGGARPGQGAPGGYGENRNNSTRSRLSTSLECNPT